MRYLLLLIVACAGCGETPERSNYVPLRNHIADPSFPRPSRAGFASQSGAIEAARKRIFYAGHPKSARNYEHSPEDISQSALDSFLSSPASDGGFNVEFDDGFWIEARPFGLDEYAWHWTMKLYDPTGNESLPRLSLSFMGHNDDVTLRLMVEILVRQARGEPAPEP